MRRRTFIAGAIIAALGTSTAVAAPAATYRLSASKTGLKFNTTTIRAKAGKVTLSMANPSSLPHAVGIKGKGKGRTVGKGGTSTYTATRRRAPTPSTARSTGHEAGGMKGTLIVG